VETKSASSTNMEAEAKKQYSSPSSRDIPKQTTTSTSMSAPAGNPGTRSARRIDGSMPIPVRTSGCDRSRKRTLLGYMRCLASTMRNRCACCSSRCRSSPRGDAGGCATLTTDWPTPGGAQVKGKHPSRLLAVPLIAWHAISSRPPPTAAILRL